MFLSDPDFMLINNCVRYYHHYLSIKKSDQDLDKFNQRIVQVAKIKLSPVVLALCAGIVKA